MIDCPSCGSTHMGLDCGLSFAERLRTVRIDDASLETRDLQNYYDAEAVAETFGEDAEDRMLEETKGRGYGVRLPDGSLGRHDPKSGEDVRLSDAEAREIYLDGPEVEEVA